MQEQLRSKSLMDRLPHILALLVLVLKFSFVDVLAAQGIINPQFNKQLWQGELRSMEQQKWSVHSLNGQLFDGEALDVHELSTLNISLVSRLKINGNWALSLIAPSGEAYDYKVEHRKKTQSLMASLGEAAKKWEEGQYRLELRYESDSGILMKTLELHYSKDALQLKSQKTVDAEERALVFNRAFNIAEKPKSEGQNDFLQLAAHTSSSLFTANKSKAYLVQAENTVYLLATNDFGNFELSQLKPSAEAFQYLSPSENGVHIALRDELKKAVSLKSPVVYLENSEELRATGFPVIFERPQADLANLQVIQTPEHVRFEWSNRLAPLLGRIEVYRQDKSEPIAVLSQLERFSSFIDKSTGFNRDNDYQFIVFDQAGEEIKNTQYKIAFGKDKFLVGNGTAGRARLHELEVSGRGSELPQSTQVELTYANMDDFKPSAFTPITRLYQLEPSGTRFRKALAASLYYDKSRLPEWLPESEIRVFIRDNAESAWESLKITGHDPKNQRIDFEIPHFSEIVAGFASAPTESQTRFNVNTKPIELEVPDPHEGLPSLSLPSPNQQGSFSESLSFNLPSGAPGPSPSLSLNYSMSGGHGIVGKGWSLSQSSIVRRGENGYPAFDESDRFFYNGVELIYWPDRSYYQPGDALSGVDDYIVYRSKQGGFAEYRRYADHWEIHSGDLVSVFGSTANEDSSEVVGQNLAQTMTGEVQWYLTKVLKLRPTTAVDFSKDNALGFVEYTYINDEGFVYLDQIIYLDFVIDLIYDVSTEFKNAHHAHGKYVDMHHLLDSVQVYWQGDAIHQYTLDYEQNINGENELIRFALEDINNRDEHTELYFYDFNYADVTHEYKTDFEVWNPDLLANGTANPEAIPYEDFRRQMIDMNADGKVDILVDLAGTSEEAARFKIYTNSGSGFFEGEIPGFVTLTSGKESSRLNFADANGDGLIDLHYYKVPSASHSMDLEVYLQDDNGFSQTKSPAYSMQRTEPNFRIGMNDFNGDGLPDLSINQYGYNDNNTRTWSVYTNTGEGYVSTELNWTIPVAYSDSQLIRADFNGDGLADAGVWDLEEKIDVYFGTKTGFLNTAVTYDRPNYTAYDEPSLRDFNLDGLPDLVYMDQFENKVKIIPNELTNFAQGHAWEMDLPVNVFSQNIFSMEEKTRGGYVDLWTSTDYAPAHWNNLKLFANNGSSFEELTTLDLDVDTYNKTSLSDMDGDGYKDLIYLDYYYQGDGGYHIKRRLPNYGGLLTNMCLNDMSSLSLSYEQNDKGAGSKHTVLREARLDTGLKEGDPLDIPSWVKFYYEDFTIDRSEDVLYGYEKVRVVDQLGNEKHTLFFTDNKDLAGRPRENRNYQNVGDSPGSPELFLTEVASTDYEVIKLNANYLEVFNDEDEEIRLVLPTETRKVNYSFFYDHSLSPEGQREAYTSTKTINEYYGLDHISGTTADAFFLLYRKRALGKYNIVNGNDVFEKDNSTTIYNYASQEPNAQSLRFRQPRTYLESQFVDFNGDGELSDDDWLTKNDFTYFDNLPLGKIGADAQVSAQETFNGYDEEGEERYLTKELVYNLDTGFLIESIDARGHSTHYEYSSDGRYLKKETSALGASTETVKDPVWGFVLSTTDQAGRTSRFRYDAWGRVIATYGPKDRFSPDINEDNASDRWDQVSQNFNELKTKTLNATSSSGDMPFSLVHFSTDSVYGVHKSQVYTRHDHLDATTDNELASVFYTMVGFWDGLGREVQKQILTGDNSFLASAKVEYDAFYRVTNAWDPKPLSQTDHTYGDYVLGADAYGDEPSFTEYDSFGRTVREGKGRFFSKTIYTSPLVSTSEDAEGNRKSAYYNERGELEEVREFINEGSASSPDYQAANTIAHTYDTYGQLTETRVNNDPPLEMFYDLNGQKTNMIDPDLGEYSYAYDEFGQLTQQIDAAFVTNSLFYDDFGRIVSNVYSAAEDSEYLENADETYVYSDNPATLGQVIEQRDDSGRLLYGYNAFGELVREVKTIENHTYATEYEYDPYGRMKILTYPYEIKPLPEDKTLEDLFIEKQQSITHYNSGKLKNDNVLIADENIVIGDEVFEEGSSTTLIADSVSLLPGTHIKPGAILEAKTPEDIFRVLYSYSERNSFLTSVDEADANGDAINGENFLTINDYDHYGRRLEQTFGNDVATSYTYHASEQVLENQTVNGSGWHEKTDYVFDDLMRVESKNLLRNGGESLNENYAYDELGRLINRSASGSILDNAENETFTYADNGNILSKGKTFNYVYDPNRPHAVRSYQGENKAGEQYTVSLTYDERGSVVEKNKEDADAGTLQLEYNQDNRVSSIYKDGALAREYKYDLAGERCFAREYGQKNRSIFYRSGLDQQIHSSAGKERIRHIFDGINRIAAVKEFAGERSKYFLHQDNLGSTSLITLADGQRLSAYHYSAFGEISQKVSFGIFHSDALDSVGAVAYTGQELDEELGLYYYGARWYDPEAGRFLQADWVIDGENTAVGYNRYVYVHNNPVNYTDPSGEFLFTVFAVIIPSVIATTINSINNGEFTPTLSVNIGFASASVGYSQSGGAFASAGVGFQIADGVGASVNLSVNKDGFSVGGNVGLQFGDFSVGLNASANFGWDGSYQGSSIGLGISYGGELGLSGNLGVNAHFGPDGYSGWGVSASVSYNTAQQANSGSTYRMGSTIGVGYTNYNNGASGFNYTASVTTSYVGKNSGYLQTYNASISYDEISGEYSAGASSSFTDDEKAIEKFNIDNFARVNEVNTKMRELITLISNNKEIKVAFVSSAGNSYEEEFMEAAEQLEDHIIIEIASGADIVNYIDSLSDGEKIISLYYFGHSSYEGLYLENDSGLYYTSANLDFTNTSSLTENARYLSDINYKNISYNAKVVFKSCNTAVPITSRDDLILDLGLNHINIANETSARANYNRFRNVKVYGYPGIANIQYDGNNASDWGLQTGSGQNYAVDTEAYNVY